jgi:hypothetical protein
MVLNEDVPGLWEEVCGDVAAAVGLQAERKHVSMQLGLFEKI